MNGSTGNKANSAPLELGLGLSLEFPEKEMPRSKPMILYSTSLIPIESKPIKVVLLLLL